MKTSLVLLSLFAAVAQTQAQNTSSKLWVSTVNGAPVPGAAGSTTQAACEALNTTRAIAARAFYECRLLQQVDPAAPAPSPAPSPAPAPSPPPPPPPTGGLQVFFADCAPGAAPGCVPGNDANPGTQLAPKRLFTAYPFNSAPAGMQLLLKRGGAWVIGVTRFENNNVTPAAPLVVADWGTGPVPLVKGNNPTNGTVEFGGWNNTNNDGGYTFRNIKFDGQGIAPWGFHLRDNLRNVTLDGVEITGFGIGIHSQPTGPYGITGTVIRNSTISRNGGMGMLGKFAGLVMEDNLFEANNFSGSSFNHAVYLSGSSAGGDNGVIRRNRFRNNSAVNGVCTGGNVTFHGAMTNWLIEDNAIEQAASTGGCYGLSITPGYHSPEWFRRFVVRGNTLVNVGGCGICAGAAPGILIERNVIKHRLPTPLTGILIPTNVEPGSLASIGDDVDAGAVVRDNTVCFSGGNPNQSGARVSGAGAAVTNTQVITGAAALTGVCAP